MIEKLDLRENVEIIPIKGSCHDYCLAKSSVLIKINELVDAVNELQTKVNKLEPNINFAQPEVKENVQDKFAEQRKWIGKLCWVWDDDSDERTFTKLNEIIEDDDDRPFKAFSRWKHCEPVKPDDDIIYKGGKDE